MQKKDDKIILPILSIILRISEFSGMSFIEVPYYIKNEPEVQKEGLMS